MTEIRRTVLLTGAAGGMGAGTCAVLLDRGWNIFALDRNEQKLATLEASLNSPKLRTCAVDLASDQLESIVTPLLDDSIAGLVNLAGASIGTTYEALTDEDWRTSFAINVDAPMRLCRLIGPLLEKRAAGSIVNVSSPVGLIGAKKPSYAASKSALTGLTMTLARSLGPKGVRVNLLLPGPTITGMTNDWPAERQASVAASSWLKRMCTPDDVGRVIAFLLSDDAAYMTGAIVDMTAGSMHGH